MACKFIQVYNDLGAGEHSLSQLLHSLSYLANNYQIIQTTGEELKHGKNLDQTALLCFGGGYDLGFLKTLGENGCERIRQYIQNGGRYLGLCAGAYFASEQCVFDKGGPLEVVGKRYIRLFAGRFEFPSAYLFVQGNAIGPYYPGFVYNSEEGSRAVWICRQMNGLTPSSVIAYFNGGCTFKTVEHIHSKVLYTYADTNDPAIIASKLGQGWGILSGVHLEYDPKLLRESDTSPKCQSVADKLDAGNPDRIELFNQLLKLLLHNDYSSLE